MMSNTDLESAQQDITAFVHWVLEFLGRLREAGGLETQEGPLFDAKALERVGAAWRPFMEDFSHWEDRIQHPDAQAIARLQAHGLYGTQLGAKLWLVFYVHARLLNSLPPAARSHLSVPIDENNALYDTFRQATAALLSSPARKIQERTQEILKTVIETIDIPLDSIVAALGLDGSVTEIKKMFGVSISP